MVKKLFICIFIILISSFSNAKDKQQYELSFDENGHALVTKMQSDGMVFTFNGVILPGDNINKDIPAEIRKQITDKWDELYSVVELQEIDIKEAYEEVKVKVIKEYREEEAGFDIINKELHRKIRKVPIYEQQPERRLKENIFIDQEDGKIYLKVEKKGNVFKSGNNFIQYVKKK